MPTIHSIEIYGKANAFFDKLKLNHASSGKEIREVADSEGGLIGDGMQELVGVGTFG